MLEANSLGFSHGAAEVLAGVSLSLARGELVGIVGPNGAGKSTLLRCLAGVAAPSCGQVTVAGRPMAAIPRRQAAQLVAYCPQEEAQRFGFTVFESVLMGRHPWLARFGSPSASDLALARRALTETDLAHLADRAVTDISGGEKRRAALARTLTQAAPVLLLDEPVAGLDVRHALAAMRLLRARARAGAAVAVVLHDLNLAAAHCCRVLMLRAGRVVALGPAEETVTAQNVAAVFEVACLVDRGPKGALRVTYLED